MRWSVGVHTELWVGRGGKTEFMYAASIGHVVAMRLIDARMVELSR